MIAVWLDWAFSRNKLVLSDAFLDRCDGQAKFLDHHMIEEEPPTGLKTRVCAAVIPPLIGYERVSVCSDKEPVTGPLGSGASVPTSVVADVGRRY